MSAVYIEQCKALSKAARKAAWAQHPPQRKVAALDGGPMWGQTPEAGQGHWIRSA